MAKVSVKLADAPIESVTLTLTPEEAQALHSLLGNLSYEKAASIIKNGDTKVLIGTKVGDPVCLWDDLDDELHKHASFFKGTVGQ